MFIVPPHFSTELVMLIIPSPCKWFDIETKAVVNGLEVSNKDFNNAQEIVQKGASNPTPVVATTQNKTM